MSLTGLARRGACVGPGVCESMAKMRGDSRSRREGGCRSADKGAYEAAPHDTLAHIHTRRGMTTTLITARIDLTLL